MKKVLVELRVSAGSTMGTIAEMDAVQLPGFKVDQDYEPVPVAAPEDMRESLASLNEEIVLIRGELDEEIEKELRAQPNVISVWTDARVEAFEETNPRTFRDRCADPQARPKSR